MMATRDEDAGPVAGNLSLSALCYPHPLPSWAVPPPGVRTVDNWKPNKLFAPLADDCRRWTNDDRSALVRTV